MAFPTTITLSGAGTPAVNGVYTLSSSLDTNGYQYYANSGGTEFIGFAQALGYWAVATTLSAIVTAGSASIAQYLYYGPSNTPPTTIVHFSGTTGVSPDPTTVFSAGAPTAPTAPTFGATTTGIASLTVNTQTLTTNATSENIQFSTDPTFATGVAALSVTAPGSPSYLVALSSGTTYYIRIQMIGSGGTTNGPSSTVNFDTAAPVCSGAVVNGAGTLLTISFTDSSLPLINLACVPTLTLSGGACTLSSITFGSNYITGVPSRTINAGETGTVSILAAKLSDSAVPTNNQSAAITAQAISNASIQVVPIVILYGTTQIVSAVPQNNGNVILTIVATGLITKWDILRCEHDVADPRRDHGPYVSVATGSTSTTVTDTTAVLGKLYYYYLIGRNINSIAVAESLHAVANTGITATGALVATPTLNSMALSVTVPAGYTGTLDGYHWYRTCVNHAELLSQFKLIGVTTGITFTDNTVERNQAYKYYAAAFNAQTGDGFTSGITSVTSA